VGNRWRKGEGGGQRAQRDREVLGEERREKKEQTKKGDSRGGKARNYIRETWTGGTSNLKDGDVRHRGHHCSCPLRAP
jgi:hypothetical protein